MDQFDQLDIRLVIRDNLDQFREMPRVPFLDSHGEQVQVLFDLFKEGDGLDDVLVLSGDVSGDLRSGERVTETQTDFHEVRILEIYKSF